MKDNNEEFSRGDPDRSKKFFLVSAAGIIIPLLCVTVGVFMSTQLFAAYMNYDPEVIGDPLKVLSNGYRIYNPVYFILGCIKYFGDEDFSDYIFKSVPPVIIGFVVALITYMLRGVLFAGHQKNQHIYGTARWAHIKDLIRFGLMQKYGIVCGETANAPVTYKIGGENNDKLILHLKNSVWREYITHQPPKAGRLVCHSGATNTWVIAPTRSGKGVGCIIPTLLNYGVPYFGWTYDKKSFFFKAFGGAFKFLAKKEKAIKGRGSVIVFDPKGENWEATAGFRSRFSTCLPFNPMQIDDSHGKPMGTVHYNPIHEIPDSKSDAFAWSDMFGEFFFSQNDSGENAFFYKNARDIFTAVIMHVRFSREIPSKEKTFTRVLEIFSMPPEESSDDDPEGGTGAAMLRKLREDGIHVHDDGTPFPEIHKLISDAANRSEIMTPKERASVYSTVFSELNNFQDPLIKECTSYSDFSVRDFIESGNGISLYLIIPYNHIKRISPLFRLLINFIIRVFSDGATNANSQKLSVPCTFVLDEFPVLGKFEEIEQNAGVLAGYGVTFLLVSQSLSQIVKLYGEHHAFLDHCKNVVLYTPGKYSDAKEFSEAIGNRSVLLDNISASGNRHEAGLRSVSLSSQETSVSLISPDELMKLEFNRFILLTQGMAPYKGKKVVYYEDPRFSRIAFLPIPELEHLMKRVRNLPSNKKRKAAVSAAIKPDAFTAPKIKKSSEVQIKQIQDTELYFMEA